MDIDVDKWFIKSRNKCEFRREVFAYNLGKDYLNIAEIKTLSETDIQDLVSSNNLNNTNNPNSQNTWLSKLVDSYTETDVPVRDLDLAMARELLFSLWIRKRDIHSDNRGYIKNTEIPVCFDFGASLNLEPELKDIITFFHGPFLYGYASGWRILPKKNIDLTTVNVRCLENQVKLLTILFVNDECGFLNILDSQVMYFKEIFSKDYTQQLIDVGFTTEVSCEINNMLSNNIENLDSDLCELKKIITLHVNLNNLLI